MTGPEAPDERAATWRSLRSAASRELSDEDEARRLVEEVSGMSAAALVTALDEPAPADAAVRLASLVGRRRAGEPLQHVIGHWSFRTVELAVDGRALVPRPETEVVAGYALAELERRREGLELAVAASGPPPPGEEDLPVPLVAVDLGTGSGAIACAILAESDDVEVVGVDVSGDAVDLARENAERLGVPALRGRFLVGDWYLGVADFLHGLVDCVVSNPPYLADGEWADLDPVVRDHDPYDALVAGPTGLEAIEAVVAGAPRVLAPGGALVVEIAPHQAEAASALARAAGARRVQVEKDLAGRDRVLVAEW
ncbi:MAG: peptide chain release factor N(5)-glutamine methyltransferase [Actinomycetota bacterium]|nr:peptide chain release factor N(5)-glutamine methyltransferase [Actinomycetota bacterium]